MSPYRQHHRPPHGAALLLTLFMLALITIITVGFISGMRSELRSSTAIYNVQETKMIAQGALAHAISLLRENIPDPESLPDSLALTTDKVGAGNANHWALNPGRLTLGDGTIIPLHTGVGTGNDSNLYVDINEPVPGSTAPLGGTIPPPAIAWPTDSDGNPTDLNATNRPKMRLAWIDVLEDPASPASETNPIVGRHAFWIDDESARLNYNIALGKPANITTHPNYGTFTGRTTPKYVYGGEYGYDPEVTAKWGQTGRLWSLGFPQGVNLDTVLDDLGLTEVEETDLLVSKFYNFFAQGGVKIPEGILGFLPPSVAAPTAEDWFHRNKFNITHYSRAPEINTFGRLRVLPGFGLISLETSGLFQHPFEYKGVSHNYGAFHHSHSVNRYARRESVVHNLYGYMARRDWPGFKGTSFVDKYGEAEAFQIALNMLSFMHETGTNSLWHDFADGIRFQARHNIRYPPPNATHPEGLNLLTEMTPESYFWVNPYAPDPNYTSGYREQLPQNRGPFITEIIVHAKPVLASDRDGNPNTDHFTFKVWWEAELYLPPYSFGLDSNKNHDALVQNDYFGVRIESSDPAKLKLENVGWDNAGGLPTHWTMNGHPPTGGYQLENWTRGGWQGWPNMFFSADLDPLDTDPSQPQVGATGGTLGVPRNFKIFPSPKLRVSYFPNRILDWETFGNQNEQIVENAATRAIIDNSTVGDPSSLRLDFDINVRLGIASRDRFPIQVVPHPYENDGDIRTDFDPGSVLNAKLAFTHGELVTETQKSYSFQVSDPMRGHFHHEWTGEAGDGTPGAPNPDWPGDEYNSPQFAKLRGQEADGAWIKPPGFPAAITLGSQSYLNYRAIFPTSGNFSIIRNDLATPDSVGWGTLAFNDNPAFANSTVTPAAHAALPDYLLLDLVSACYPNTANQSRNTDIGPDSYSSVTFQHSCAGRVNLNAKIYPDAPGTFEAPARHRPLKAVFRYLRSDDDIDVLVSQIVSSPDGPYFYTGQISALDAYEGEPPSSASDESPQTNAHSARITEPEWSKDELLRNMNGCLTVNSNTFGIWGAAQKVKKSPANSKFGTFEPGDRVLGEKRFYALVERYLWTGRDGRVGNAHVDPTSGEWDRKADSDHSWFHYGQHPGSPGDLAWASSGTFKPWAVVDGPVTPEEAPIYIFKDPQLGTTNLSGDSGIVPSTVTSLENADNPITPVVKFRVLYFKYLDE